MKSRGHPTSGGPSPDADGDQPVDSAVWTLRIWRESGAATGVRARIIAVTMDGPPKRRTEVTDSVEDVLARLRTFLAHTTATWPPAGHRPAPRH